MRMAELQEGLSWSRCQVTDNPDGLHTVTDGPARRAQSGK